uniref:SCAN box domain-containing protein n=1 Tax=Chrysemys picta bellii TaxID=8478 RepID=A0A8C3HMW6_CHRPI
MRYIHSIELSEVQVNPWYMQGRLYVFCCPKHNRQAAFGGAPVDGPLVTQIRWHARGRSANPAPSACPPPKSRRSHGTGGPPAGMPPKLMDWATRWLRPEAQTEGEIMGMLILEQFLHGLPENIRVWLRRHQSSRVEAAVKLMEEYTEADFPRKEDTHIRKKKPGEKPGNPRPGRVRIKNGRTTRELPMGLGRSSAGSAGDRDIKRGTARTWNVAFHTVLRDPFLTLHSQLWI